MADLPKNAEDLKRLQKALEDYTDSIRRSESVFGSTAIAIEKAMIGQKAYAEAVAAAKAGNSDQLKAMQESLTIAGQIGNAFLNAADGTRTYAEQFSLLTRGITAANSPILGGIVNMVKGYDEATTITRRFKTAAIDVGTAFGESFATIQPQFAQYASAVRLAQNYTYETRDAIERQTRALATMGVSMREMTQTTYVGNTAQNMLSEGFLLATQTGLNTDTVFQKMAVASRKMGIDFADAGKPLIDLQRIARETGLPMEELTNKAFGLAEKYARFGLTVDGLSPIIKRFTDVLGTGFKGLAIDEVQNLVEGLGRQVNTTQAAFLAMQSGMARPGAGVAGAMLDFEAAMAKPEEAMRMLATSLGNIGGGKIMKFEEARTGGESAAAQFKLQRDMLTQLTGINDPQQTRTLLAILSDLQSGRQVTQDQKDTLDSALKSGQQKQDEKATAQERLMKVLVGLFTDADIKLGRMAERYLPSPQAQAAAFAKGDAGIREAETYLLQKAERIGDQVLPESAKRVFAKGGELLQKGLNAIEPGPELRGPKEAPVIAPFYRPVVTAPEALKPTASIGAPPAAANLAAAPAKTTGPTTVATGTNTGGQQMTVVFRGEGEIMQALAKAAVAIHNNTLRGSG